MVRRAVRSFWAEPRVPDAPRRVWRDWVLVAALATATILEGLLRQDVVWRPVALVLTSVVVVSLLWRRTSPLLVVAVAFGAVAVGALAAFVGAGEPVGLYASACLLLLPYSLLRWGAGREAAIGLIVILVTGVVCVASDFTGLVDALIGIPFLLLPAALGASVRYRASARLRETDQVKLREREQLARELHDTVAHHVSAIAVRAQAGRTLAASRPTAAVEALEVIEEAASRTLAELRTLVGALRRSEEPDLAPQRGVTDIERLAHSAGDGDDGDRPRVDVELSGRLADLRPLVGAAVYRLAQESVTNAVRHARHATRIDVRVTGDADSVRLTVHDDGDADPVGPGSGSGYGLVGMTERATLLGGTLQAGPAPDRGWTVDAVLPRHGTSA